ncbi:MAG: hypothetical protein C0620_07735 [Desulfuromonas sp.]|nr:MAG: hypothetical protein C0620_07735 [Desulfuromonas sp.]
MSEFKLHSIYQSGDFVPGADIVFIHGLGGDPYDTWTTGDNFWPKWLSESFPHVNIWSLGHPSKKIASMLEGRGMGISDRARAIVDYFESMEIGTRRPVVFIVHSLGGLLIKAALRKSSDMAGGGGSTLIQSTAGVAFMATPHSGSSFASAAQVIDSYLKLKFSKVVLELKKDSGFLDELNDWYSSYAPHNSIETVAYFEIVKYLDKIQIVSKTSSDPRVHGCFPVGVDSDHFGICKFKTADNPTYLSINKFLNKCITNKKTLVNIDFDEFYTTKKVGDRKELCDKLTAGGRADKISYAENSKKRVSTLLHKYKLLGSSSAEQTKFIKDVFNRFDLSVKPMIDDGESIKSVNEEIVNRVITPMLQNKTIFFGEEASESDIMDVIYFLTGHCHIKWSQD